MPIPSSLQSIASSIVFHGKCFSSPSFLASSVITFRSGQHSPIGSITLFSSLMEAGVPTYQSRSSLVHTGSTMSAYFAVEVMNMSMTTTISAFFSDSMTPFALASVSTGLPLFITMALTGYGLPVRMASYMAGLSESMMSPHGMFIFLMRGCLSIPIALATTSGGTSSRPTPTSFSSKKMLVHVGVTTWPP